ncbi:MAG: hypothetical protein KDA32_12020 [Phycisphaerales bacterium]|nr:hypothetical protein [Phycisphaerales bacterium]
MKAAKILAAVAILAIAGWRIFSIDASTPPPGQSEEHLLPLICKSCGKSFVGRVHKPPTVWKCKLCGQDTAVETRHCVDCDAVFPLPDDDGPCPKCGGPIDLPELTMLDDPSMDNN